MKGILVLGFDYKDNERFQIDLRTQIIINSLYQDAKLRHVRIN